MINLDKLSISLKLVESWRPDLRNIFKVNSGEALTVVEEHIKKLCDH